jgi:hypothetical protein
VGNTGAACRAPSRAAVAEYEVGLFSLTVCWAVWNIQGPWQPFLPFQIARKENGFSSGGVPPVAEFCAEFTEREK